MQYRAVCERGKMLFYVSFLYLSFIKEAYVMAEEKCMKTEDIKLEKGGFISCAERIIIVKGLKMYTENGKGRYSCSERPSKIYQILNCTGQRHTCSTKDVDILAIIEEEIKYCSGFVNVCIIFYCIPGPLENMMNSQSLTRPLGSFFQAVHFSGILRCSVFGDISQITLHRADPTDILVRNKYGSRIFEYKYGCYNYSSDDYSFGYFTCNQHLSQVGAIEITIYSKQFRNIILSIEGVTLYQCQNSTYMPETNDHIWKLASTLNDEIKCEWSSKDFLPWTTTLLSSVLSLFLTVIYVIKCSSWANLKETQSKTTSTVELPSSHQGCSKVRRNVTDNNYETPHHYTEIQV